MPERDHPGRPFPPWLVALLGVAAVAAVLSIARPVLVPVALAALLAFLLAPVANRLERLGVARTLAMFSIMAGATIGIALLGWVMQRQARELADRLPEYRSNIEQKVEALKSLQSGLLGRGELALRRLGEKLAESPEPGPDSQTTEPGTAPTPVVIHEQPSPPITYLRAAVAPILGPLATGIIVIVLAGFMLLKREDLRSRIVRLAGIRMLTDTTEIIDDVAGRMSRFLLLFAVINGSVGVLVGFALFIIGVPNAALWGLLTAVLRFVPYVGVWTAAMFPVALSFAAFPGWNEPLLVIGCFLLVELVTFHWIEPHLLGAGTGISPLALLVTTIFWTWLWGPAGMLLATPLTVCVVVVARHVPKLAFLDVLLSDERPLSPEVELYQRMLAESGAQAQRVVTSYGKEHGAEAAYDLLILPALRLAEIDWHRGALDDERRSAVHAAVRDGIASVDVPRIEGARTGNARVCCVPARDAADELAAGMIVKLLEGTGMQAEVSPAEAFVGETVERILADLPAIVCVSALPPRALLHARAICKKLRAKHADLPIVVGLWGASPDERYEIGELERAGATAIAVSLAEAARMIRSRVAVGQKPEATARAAPALQAIADPSQL